MSDFIPSLIRTWVPVAVGVVLSWLSSKWGITDVDGQTAAATVTGLFIGVYYALIRALESRWPVVGTLLGRRSTPSYQQ